MPPDYAAEMVPFDPLVGEFRVHYAGFFDPGFGYAGAGGQGSRAVLEVRSREVPFILEHGQIVGRLVYEKMTVTARRDVWPATVGSNYQAQGLKLKQAFPGVNPSLRAQRSNPRLSTGTDGLLRCIRSRRPFLSRRRFRRRRHAPHRVADVVGDQKRALLVQPPAGALGDIADLDDLLRPARATSIPVRRSTTSTWSRCPGSSAGRRRRGGAAAGARAGTAPAGWARSAASTGRG